MSTYTTSIKDLMQSQVGNKDDWGTYQMYQYSKQCFFDDDVMSVIKEPYRQHFITSFAYHYFLREIGLETFGLWKFALNGKIYENADYINKIYDTMAKDIFTDYTVKRRKGSDNVIGNKIVGGSEDIDRTIDNKGDSSANSKSNAGSEQTTTNDLQNKTEYNSHQKNTGTTTRKRTGDDTEKLSGSDWTKEYGQEKNHHGGHDDETQNGARVSERGGKQISTQSGSYTDNTNEILLHSDTPMGSLENMRTPNENAAGQGVGYATGANKQYNYLSDAQERDHTSKRDYDNYQNVTEYQGFSDTERFDNYKRQMNYNSDSVLSFADRKTENEYGRNNKTEYNSQDQQIDDTTSARLGYDVQKSTGTQNVKVNSNEQGNSSEEHKDLTKDTTNKIRTEEADHTLDRDYNEDIEEFSVKYEMLLRLQPLMQKIWPVFDPIFMGIC